MYKVFLNERFIVLGEDNTVSDQKGEVEKSIGIGDLGELPEIIRNFLYGNEKAIHLQFYNETELLENFKKHFIEIPAAGGIVKKGENLLFIFRNGRWDLPKGKIDPGETPQVAAIREVQEECGITLLQIKRELPSTFHIYQTPFTDPSGLWVLKETSWFEMEYSGFKEPLAKEDEGITEVNWIKKANLANILPLTWPSLRPVISVYC